MTNYISPGSGVAKEESLKSDTPDDFLDSENVPELPIEPYKNRLPNDYADVPSLQGQLVTHPETVKSSSRLVKVFDLSDPSQQEEYSRLKAQTLPDDSPRLVIESEVREFHSGVFYVLVQYVELKYKKLAPRQNA